VVPTKAGSLPTREAVRQLVAEGRTTSEIASALGVAPNTVSYHKGRLNRPVSAKFRRRHDWTEIQRYYDEGHSRRECQLRFGFSSRTWQKAVKRGAIVTRPQALPLEELLRKGPVRGRWNIRQRLIEAGLKALRCEECGITTWQREPVSLALHHVNGDGGDNRLENLALLCQNCHSQTPNFGVKTERRDPGRPRDR
jgi:5-methylcytosine-specific restriction endonuclease McrA